MSSYLELLNLTREPFSNSPDPDAYYRTPTHEDCLNRLEIAIRLRRGLNVVLGEVGTGKEHAVPLSAEEPERAERHRRLFAVGRGVRGCR